MTKALKRRFIIFSMMAVTCLLIFIVLAINGVNWMMLERQSDIVLETLADAGGVFQKWTLTVRVLFHNLSTWTECILHASLLSGAIRTAISKISIQIIFLPLIMRPPKIMPWQYGKREKNPDAWMGTNSP